MCNICYLCKKKKMAVYFSTDSRCNKNGDSLIRLSWHYNGTRFQTTIGLTTQHDIFENRVKAGDKKNSKNMTFKEINYLLEKVENFLKRCEAYSMKIGVDLQCGTMRALYRDFKSSNYSNETEIIEKWIVVSPSNGEYWRSYDDNFYKKLCIATDSTADEKKYVIYQELFGHSRILSMPIGDFYGNVEYNGKIVKRFEEESSEIALWF